jgi:hypothetical protein
MGERQSPAIVGAGGGEPRLLWLREEGEVLAGTGTPSWRGAVRAYLGMEPDEARERVLRGMTTTSLLTLSLPCKAKTERGLIELGDDGCFGLAVARQHSDHVCVCGCLVWLRMTPRLKAARHTH